MALGNVALQAFNRGLVSALGLARTDLKKLAMAASVMVNWMPRVLGSMMLRPGWNYLGASFGNNPAKYIDFVFSTTDTALVEITNLNVSVWVNDVVISRPAVTAAIANGTFNGNLNNWNSADQAGAVSVWVAGNYMGLTGDSTATNFAKRQQTVIVNQLGIEHALHIIINKGPVILRVGSTVGADDYIAQTSLDAGVHSLALTPTGNFTIEFSSNTTYQVLVQSCVIEAAGQMSIASPWLTADLNNIRKDQSGDVLFIACKGYQQRKIERRSTRSWSVVKYQTQNGPFLLENTGTITLTPSGLSGSITVTASAPLFKSTHVGALFRITSTGQDVQASISAQNLFTTAIKITGTGTGRAFAILLSGTWTATVTLQQSLVSSAGPWTDMAPTYAINQNINFNDTLDNQTVWYRIGVKTGNYTNGTVVAELKYARGATDGVIGITGFTDSTHVTADVYPALVDAVTGVFGGVASGLGGTSATTNWAEGKWSDYRGWPTCVGFAEGRLWWAGKDAVDGSASDAFASYDPNTLGDSGPIDRSIGSGPVDTINWILALQRMLLGAEGSEFVCASSSFDQPLLPTDTNLKSCSTQGSAPIQALKLDKQGIFVQRGGTRVYELALQNVYLFWYGSTDLTLMVPEVCRPQIVRMAIQRQPDTRIHCVLSDGTVSVMIFDRDEEVNCWIKVTTDGLVEDVVVLPSSPGSYEDAVYYSINRTINGVTKRYLERWAIETDCQGSTLNKQADAFVLYSGIPTTIITGLAHLEAKTVVVWGDGKDLGTYLVTGGQITGLTSAVSNAVVGLGYTAQWQSTKLAYASQLGTALVQKKRVSHLGVILLNTHYQGLTYGSDFNHLDNLPLTKDGAVIAADTIFSTYDQEPFEFDGIWDSDSRLCLQAQAPRPCNILAAVVGMESEDKI